LDKLPVYDFLLSKPHTSWGHVRTLAVHFLLRAFLGNKLNLALILILSVIPSAFSTWDRLSVACLLLGESPDFPPAVSVSSVPAASFSWDWLSALCFLLEA